MSRRLRTQVRRFSRCECSGLTQLSRRSQTAATETAGATIFFATDTATSTPSRVLRREGAHHDRSLRERRGDRHH
jgi:hypothetical protein